MVVDVIVTSVVDGAVVRMVGEVEHTVAEVVVVVTPVLGVFLIELVVVTLTECGTRLHE